MVKLDVSSLIKWKVIVYLTKKDNHMVLINKDQTIFMNHIFDDVLTFNYDFLKMLVTVKIENFDLIIGDDKNSHTFTNLIVSRCVKKYRALVKDGKLLTHNDILKIIK